MYPSTARRAEGQERYGFVTAQHEWWCGIRSRAATGHESVQMGLSRAGREIVVVDESEFRMRDFGSKHRLDGLGKHDHASAVIRYGQVSGVTSGFGVVFHAPAERPPGDQIACTAVGFKLAAVDRKLRQAFEFVVRRRGREGDRLLPMAIRPSEALRSSALQDLQSQQELLAATWLGSRCNGVTSLGARNRGALGRLRAFGEVVFGDQTPMALHILANQVSDRAAVEVLR